MTDRQIITVSELNSYVKLLIDSDTVLRNIAVKGEISNYRPNTSGHLYFSLKDEGGVVRAVMFRTNALRLKFAPENGMKVIATGSISVFVRDGQYQLYVTELIPDGIGSLFLAFEQLKEKLGKEGLFAPEHKKPTPAFPNKIAIITSPTGAAIRDMLRILKKRYPLAKVLIVPVKVQGDFSAEEIAGAIRLVNTKNAADLIIVGRGGGSIEDLWSFNEEIVARAIYDSKIPVISGVGHEPDFTIADFVADLRAATPSNAAELAVPDISELYIRLGEYEGNLRRMISTKLSMLSQRLKLLSEKKVFSSPLSYIDERRLYLDYITRRLASAGIKILNEQEKRFAYAAARLDSMSPLKVLGRGYSIAVKADRKAVRSSKELKIGEKLNIKFASGDALCEVKEIQ